MKRLLGTIVLVSVVGSLLFLFLIQSAAAPPPGPRDSAQETEVPAPPEGTPTPGTQGGEADGCSSAASAIWLGIVGVPLILGLAFVQRRFAA